MAQTVRLRRTKYDNIAAGAAITTNENTILGNTVSYNEKYGGGYYTSTSNEEREITNVAAGTSTTDDNVGPDNMTAAVDPTDENVG